MKSSLIQSQLSQGSTRKLPIVLCYKIKKMITTWRKKAKYSRHRWNILREWMETERNYIRDLDIIIQRILKPMLEQEVISEAQVSILCLNGWTSSSSSRASMLEVLQGFIKNWNPRATEIAPVLLQMYHFFKIYIDYCNQFHRGQNILKTVRNLPEVIVIEKALPMDIDSYLIKPIQRPPKYMLLLRDYRKHLPENHPDYKKLGEAMDKYPEVNDINNNAIARYSEGLQDDLPLKAVRGGTLEQQRVHKRV